jgi:hypothetical protein
MAGNVRSRPFVSSSVPFVVQIMVHRVPAVLRSMIGTPTKAEIAKTERNYDNETL